VKVSHEEGTQTQNIPFPPKGDVKSQEAGRTVKKNTQKEKRGGAEKKENLGERRRVKRGVRKEGERQALPPLKNQSSVPKQERKERGQCPEEKNQ